MVPDRAGSCSPAPVALGTCDYVLPRCALCGKSAWSQRLSGTQLRRCGSCGTLLNDRSASRADEEGRYTDGQAAATFEPERTAEALVRSLLPLLGELRLADRAVLDVGCGRGEFLESMRNAGWRVAGVEIDPVSAADCAQKGLDVTVGSIFDTGLPGGPWGVMTFWDVLDHLEDPMAALGLALQELAPGGLLVVRGRNGAVHGPLKRLFTRMKPITARCGLPDVSVVHRWGFSAQGWTSLVTQAGFKALRLHAAAMTPVDRYGSMGPRQASSSVKRLAGGVLSAVYRASGGRIYPFPSVLITAQKPPASIG